MRPEPDESTVSGSSARGAASSVTANLDDLRQLASQLMRVSTDLSGWSRTPLSIEWNLPALGDVIAPGTALACTGSAASLSASLTGSSLEALTYSLGITATVAAYEAAESRAETFFRPIEVASALTPALCRILSAIHTGSAPRMEDVADLVPPLIESLDGLLPGGYEWDVAFVSSNLVNTLTVLDHRPVKVSLVAGPSRGGAPPAARSISEAMQRVTADYAGGNDYTTIQVQRVVDPASGQGYWTVMVPGTTPWFGKHDGLADGTGNLMAATGGRNATEVAVRAALRDAMTREGVLDKNEPVQLVGHSQGGMVAANLARHGDFAVESIVTYGSPVAARHVPRGARSLNIEKKGDVVHGLDGLKEDADDPRRTIVTLDDPQAFVTPDGSKSLVEPHSHPRYQEDYSAYVARERSDPDSPVTQFEESARPFFTGEAHTYQYEGTRGYANGEVIFGPDNAAPERGAPPERSAKPVAASPSHPDTASQLHLVTDQFIAPRGSAPYTVTQP